MSMRLFDPDELEGAGEAASPDEWAPPGEGAPRADEAAPLARARRPLTAAQERAVADRSHSLLLSASAGAGKTTVLVERFVRAVREDGIDPAAILAITFTDKAAGELRERLRRAFLERGDREAARATEGAFVSTIHGFCARLLRAHPLAAGLDPRFAVLDEPRAERLREDAFAAALRRFLPQPGALDLVAAYRVDPLGAAVRTLHDELRSRGQAEPRLPHVAPRPAPDAEREELRAAHAAFAAELASATDGKRVDAARDALEACARLLDDLDALPHDPAAGWDASRGREAARPEAGVVPWPGRLAALRVGLGGAAALSTDAAERYAAARDAFERACADHHAVAHVALIDALLAECGVSYARLKAARGALDFDDLELRARDLLRDHPEVGRHWRERFALLMVDEFQDTNRRQLEILEALEADNLFSVGDELQSIYGFRHADVSIFRGRRAALTDRGLALRLDESFRSVPPILAAVNQAFAPRFGPHFAPLRGGVGAADGPAVELLVTGAAGWEEADLGDTLPPVPAWRRAEARLVARRVAELVRSGEARAGEVAVLVRASASMPVLERALADEGLATLATAGRGFWTRQEVVDLMGYLAALANPLDEPALLTVLGSPLCGVSSDALALTTLAARAASTPPWRWLRAAFGVDAPGEDEDDPAPVLAELEPADRDRLAAFVPWLAAERRRVPAQPLDGLLDRAIARAGYDVHVLGLAGGARRMANVDKLRRLARDFEAGEGRDLRAFVDHAAALEQAQKREPEAPVEDPDLDAVRLMTIHAAKGLEFGVVVVADLGRRPNLSSPLLLADGERVGLKLSLLDGAKGMDALDYRALLDERRAAEAEEEARILYVALTRAQRRLILSGAVERWSNGATAPPLTWLGPALVPDVAARLEAATPETAVTTAGSDDVPVRLTLATPETGVVGSPAAAEATAPAGEATPLDGVGDAPDRGPTPLDGVGDAAPLAGDAAAPAGGAARLGGAPPLSPPPAPPGALSYSALAAHAACGYRFYAERVLRLPPRPAPAPAAAASPGSAAAPGLDARVRGVVVHALLETGEDATPERVAAIAATEGARPADRDAADVQRLLDRFRASATLARLDAARRVRHEHEFAFELRPGAGPLLTGVLDAVATEPDGAWLVVDFKTDRLAPTDDPAALAEAHYGIQRALYALAALRAGAPEARVVHLFGERPDQPAEARFAPADEQRLVARIAAHADPIARGEHALTPTPHAGLCATCPARGGLCPYPRELTLRPAPVAEAEPYGRPGSA